jgi:serine protease Do
VLIQDVTRELAETFGMRHPRGALVAQVLPGSPAEAAGVRAGDIILSFNGKEIATSSNLPPLVGVAKVGSEAKVQLLRDGEVIDIPLMLAELPEDDEVVVIPGQIEPAAANRLGLVVKDLSEDEREQLKIPEGGVLVESVEEGPAQQGGIRAGDVIVSFDNQPVANSGDFRSLIDAVRPGQSVAVLVQRGDGRMFYPIRVPAD